MTYDNLKFESILENDLIEIIRNAMTAQNVYPDITINRAGVFMDADKFPKITVKADPVNEDFANIYTGDMSVFCDTYMQDDKTGSELDDLVAAVRFAFIDPESDLNDRLNAASSFLTYFAAVPGEGFSDPETHVRRYTLQLQVKFSPRK